MKFKEPFTLNIFDNNENSNSVIWDTCKKEIPNIMQNELSSMQRGCLQGIYFENLTQHQVAEKLGISQPTVSRHINNAKEILFNRLKYALNVGKRIAFYYESEAEKWE